MNTFPAAPAFTSMDPAPPAGTAFGAAGAAAGAAFGAAAVSYTHLTLPTIA